MRSQGIAAVRRAGGAAPGTAPFARRWAWLLLPIPALVAAYYAHRYYGNTPWRAMREFVAAVNAEDFDRQYAVFAPFESVPMIPKDDFHRILQEMDPPFPRGFRITRHPTTVDGPFDRGRGGFTVRVLDRGQGPAPTGEWPDFLTIGTQNAGGRWRVRGYFTYFDYYRRTYGYPAAFRFKALYVQAALRRGLKLPAAMVR